MATNGASADCSKSATISFATLMCEATTIFSGESTAHIAAVTLMWYLETRAVTGNKRRYATASRQFTAASDFVHTTGMRVNSVQSATAKPHAIQLFGTAYRKVNEQCKRRMYDELYVCRTKTCRRRKS